VAEFRIGQAAELLGVSPDTLRRWVDTGRLRATKTPAGHRVIEGRELASFASSIASTKAPPAVSRVSARNRFTGLVTRVLKDKVMAQVEIAAGPHRVVSLMSTEAADELGLAPGVLATASVKATHVVVGVPDAGHG
jgi:molybdopterin-binding protein